jgi:SAM-dependent methyltransferase
MKTIDEVIRYLRSTPEHSELVRDSYLGENPLEEAGRFESSEEFCEVLNILGSYNRRGTVLDIGAGNGIASRAFANRGAKMVFALEPCPSCEVGCGAIVWRDEGLPIHVIAAMGEYIPLRDGKIDIIYARQVLHHTQDLSLVLRECARVLKSGGVFLACREHVVDDEHQRRIFLENHPVHALIGGENAFSLDTYLAAIRDAGLAIKKVLGPWDSIINAFPQARSVAELELQPRILLERRFGYLGRVASYFPLIKDLVWKRIRRPIPGRLYSFIAHKP